MGKKVAVVHTSLVSINELKALFAEILPDVTMYNIIDESQMCIRDRFAGGQPDRFADAGAGAFQLAAEKAREKGPPPL